MPVLPVTDPVLIFAITMVIVLVAPLAVHRLRLPGLVGLILAGMIVGPSVLGVLARDATFELLGTVGLLYLMFVAGVSIDLAQFAKLRGRSVLFGIVSFFIPQLMALWIGIQLLGMSVPQALLIGSIVGSHTLLAYPIADRLGITENKNLIMAMGATIVTDLLSLVILAVVIAAQAGDTSTAYWVRFAIFVGLWATAIAFILPRSGTWFFRNVRQGPALDFGFLMVALFVTAWLAGVVGLAPIIGAFLAGLLMNRFVPPQSPLMTRIKFVGDALLIPFFLISVGMLIDVGVLFSSITLWMYALIFSGMVIVGKSLAAKATQWAFRESAAAGWTVAGLTIPQAAATLAVTLVGFEVGLLSELIVNAVVVMILLTSLLGPSMVERFGRALALQEQQRPYEPGEAPQRILVPLANPETAPALMDVALAIRDKGAGQPVYPLTVAREGGNEAAAVAASEKLLAHAVVHAASADVPVVPLTRVDQNVARGVERAVRERRISTVVIGWNGESTATARVFGSILDQFLEDNRSMVFVSRLVHPLASTRRLLLLVPPFVEREPGFAAALSAIKTLASRAGTSMVVFTVRDSADAFSKWLSKTEPEVGFKMHPLDAWNDLMTQLDAGVRDGDLLCFLSVRRGTLAWRPSLHRIPRVLAGKWPDHDFIAVYLSEQETEQLAALAPTPDQDKTSLPDLPEEHITPDLRGDSLEEILERVLAPGFVDAPEVAAALVSEISAAQKDYAPELTAGLVLYHLHSSSVVSPALFVGISKEGVDLPQTAESANVVLVFLSPIETSPSTYLRQLSLLAHLVNEENLVQALCGTSTALEARSLLIGKAQRRMGDASPRPPLNLLSSE